ncbi:argininosuccinate lyase [Alicyclobacillus curvatus]|nr:argininosuccinate lyase [Alicyclobacillus curvatus]
MDIKEQIFQTEGTQFPGVSYAKTVLSPAYDNAKTRLIHPMLSIHKAHLVMLVEQSIVPIESASRIMRAIDNVNVEAFQSSHYTGAYEDLFFAIEDQILQEAGELSGNLHIARSRNDMGVAMYRMSLRESMMDVLHSIGELQSTLLTVAESHAETITLGYTHTQQAQPMTLGHYLLAVHDSLSRDYKRLFAAFHACNHSPLGAAAITTTGFPINRHRVAELLGFDGLVENSYDAIGGADYLQEITCALEIALIDLGRYTQDFLLWSTREFGAVLVAAPYVQISSIMPQKRNPVSFEHIRALASSGVGECQVVLQMLHNTPFGDIVDSEDDLQPHLWRAMALAADLFHLFGCVVGTLDVDKEKLVNRARESYASITELADTLVRAHQMGFRTAHAVASQVVKLAMQANIPAYEISASIVKNAAEVVLGHDIDISDQEVAAAMDPVHFVEIRSLPGGPAPEEVRRMITARRLSLQSRHTELDHAAQYIHTKLRELDQTAATWSREYDS